MKTTLIIISLFVVTLSAMIPIRGTDVWFVQYIALFSMFMLGISVALWKFNKYISLITMWCLFSTIFVANQSPKAMLVLLQIDLGCLAMYVISNLKQKQRELILKSMLGLVLIQGILVTLQHFNLDPIFNHISDVAKDDTVGFSGSRNQLGIFFATTSPIVISYCIWLLPFTLIGLCGSTTTTAWGAFVITCMSMVLIKYKNMIGIFVIILIMSGYIFFTKFETLSTAMIGQRFRLMQLTVHQVMHEEAIMIRREFRIAKEISEGVWSHGKMVKKVARCNRLTGFGLGNFQSISPYTQDDGVIDVWDGSSNHVYGHAHNDYVEFMFDTGLIGFVLLVVAIIDFLRRFWKAKKTKILMVSFASILAFMLCAMGVFAIQTACSSMLFIVLLGICEGELWESYQRGTKEK